MMDYNTIWNEICFHIRRYHNAVEQDFQAILEILFEKLGWSLSRGEIQSQLTIPVGSSNSVRPDMVIKHGGKAILVIELKRANTNISDRNTEQLKSYMRLLKLDYGILIGETLQVFCELPSSNNSPVKACDIRFIDNSEIGIECIEILSKQAFSFERLEEFCRKCLADQNRYCEKPATKPEYTEYPHAHGFAHKSRKLDYIDIDISRLSEYGRYGPQPKGIQIYSILCQSSDKHLYIGKQDIESELHRMSKDDIDRTTFYLYYEPSRRRSSWVRGDRFKQIYESKS